MSIAKPELYCKLEMVFKAKGNSRKFKTNEIIFMEEDQEDCLYYIDSGLVKLSMISGEGKEKTLFLLSGGQFFGEVSLGDGLEYAVNAEALADTVTYTINYKDMREMLLEDPLMVFELLKVMSEKMRLITQQVKDMVFYDITGRLASQIVTFSQQFGRETEDGIVLDLALTHQELANILGSSRVTVTKTLNQMQEEGLVRVMNRKLVITNLQQLIKYIK